MGNGLAVLQPNEVDTITIAGMGGTLITSILENGKDKLSSVKRLILQPNINAVAIRKWFLENTWELVEEEIIEEDGKIYEVLIAEKGEPLKPYEAAQLEKELLLGPILLKRKTEAFKKKWSLEMRSWQRIFEQLESAAPTEETGQKKLELQDKMNWVRRELDDEDC
jgi:tRNA (adenine22-N1)-methyltransferase